ncbi:MAG: ATP-binding protein [Acidobacteriota bacterium]
MAWVLWTAALGGAALAQKPRVETFTVEHGLPSAVISDLAQDAAGRLWILNRAGVTVYDGRTFRTYSSADGLPKGELKALEIDAQGRVWTVTRSPVRVFYLEGQAWQQLPEPTPSGEEPYTVDNLAVASGSVAADGAGAVVAVATARRGVLIWADQAWMRQSRSDVEGPEKVYALTALDDRFALGTESGLCWLRDGAYDCTVRDLDPRLSEPIYAAHSPTGAAERLWLLGASWLGVLENGRLQIATGGSDLPVSFSSRVGSIGMDRQGGVYFGWPAVAFFLDPDQPWSEANHPTPLGSREGLLSEGVTAFLADRETNVWVASRRGLNKIGSRRFLSYDRDQGLHQREVSAIAESPPGTLVLGHNTGLTFLADGRAEVVSFERPDSPLFSQRVLDMEVDLEGAVWVAAQTVGLLRLMPDRSWVVELEGHDILTVEADRDGVLWAASAHRLFRRAGAGFSEVDLGPEATALRSLRWLHTDPEGRVYLAGRGGLKWLEAGEWQLAVGPTLGSNNTFNILAESNGQVWVGTGEGLYELSGRRLVKVRRGGLEIERPVFLILQDREGRVWFGTDDGVVVWDGESARQLSVQHGLAGREANRGAGLVDHRGRVWIGTDQGLSRYESQYDFRESAEPRIELRAIEVEGQLSASEVALELSHRQRALTFHFDTTSLSREERIVYRYRLEGFDTDWIGPLPVASGEVRYTNVPPGEYHFRIGVGTAGGRWTSEASSAAIAIARPFWLQPWFYALMILTLGTTGPGIYYLRTRAIRARNAELESLTSQLNEHIAERERLIADLETKNQELERFTYTVSHDLKSPLVTIRGFLGYLEQDAKAGDLDRLEADIERIASATGTMGQLLDELLELSRIGRVVNEPVEIPLAGLVAEAVELASGQMAERGVRVTISEDLPRVFADRVRLLEVFQNLIENAVKFMGDQPEPQIEIGVRQDGQEPVITVSDNGVGIEPRFHEQVFGLFDRLDQSTPGTGVGLTLVRRIVEVHGGRIWVESEGEGGGTTFCCTLPMASS